MILPLLLTGSCLKDTVMSYGRYGLGNSFSMKGLVDGQIITGGKNTV